MSPSPSDRLADGTQRPHSHRSPLGHLYHPVRSNPHLCHDRTAPESSGLLHVHGRLADRLRASGNSCVHILHHDHRISTSGGHNLHPVHAARRHAAQILGWRGCQEQLGIPPTPAPPTEGDEVGYDNRGRLYRLLVSLLGFPDPSADGHHRSTELASGLEGLCVSRVHDP